MSQEIREDAGVNVVLKGEPTNRNTGRISTESSNVLLDPCESHALVEESSI
jgi:tRNA pseudouridine-54 N-methylase